MAGDALLLIEPLDTNPLTQLQRAVSLRERADSGDVRGACMVLEGGLLVAAADLAVASEIGVVLTSVGQAGAPESYFEESAGGLLVAVTDVARSIEEARVLGCAARQVGTVGGDALVCGSLLAIPIDRLRAKYTAFFRDVLAASGWENLSPGAPLSTSRACPGG